MKYIISLILMLSFGFSSNAQFSKATLQASGLTCSMCSKAVKSALEKVPFVQEVKVNIKSQEYVISFREGMDLDFDALKEAVVDAGFSVASLKITGNFHDIKVEKGKHIHIEGKNFHFVSGKSQSLNGEHTFTVVDKDFLPVKEYRKISQATSGECVQTGKSAGCCVKEGFAGDSRVYHVTI